MRNELCEAWDALLDMGVSEDVLRVVTDINGYNEEALSDIEFAVFGTHDLFGEDDGSEDD